MPSLGSVIAQQTTSTGGVQAARAAYDNAVAMGAATSIIVDRFNKLQIRLQEYNDKLRAKASQLDYIGASATRAAGTTIGGHASSLSQFGGAASGIGNAISGLGAIGRVAGPVGVALGAVASSADSLVKAFLERANEIGHFSPEVSAASANRRVRLMMADMREAQELGPGMSKLIEAETDIQIQIRDILLPMKKWLVENLADMLKWISDAIKGIEDSYEDIRQSMDEGWQEMKHALRFLSDDEFNQKMTEIAKEAAARRLALDEERMARQAQSLLNDFFREMAKNQLPPAIPNVPNPNGGLLNLPPFLGI